MATGSPAWPGAAVLPGVLLLLLMLLVLPAQAGTRAPLADHTLSGWSVDDGLPHNLPLAIAQDSQGWIWIATWEGVARFDGRQFTVYDRRNSDGVDLAGSSALLAQADGSMLVGNDRGVFRFHQGRWQLLHRQLAGVRSHYLQHDADGVLWVASGNVLLGLQGDAALQRFTVDDAQAQIHTLEAMADGGLLVATERGLYRMHEGHLQRWGDDRRLATLAVLDILADADGWWLATTDGLWWLDAQGRLAQRQGGERIDRLARGSDGRLWLNLHHGGLVSQDAEGDRLHYPMQGVRARSLFADRDGGIWGGTTHGVHRLTRGVAQRLAGSDGYVRAVLEDAHGTVWIGHGQGLRQIRNGQVRDVLDGLPGLAGASVLALGLAADGNGVWVGSYDRGVFHIDRHGQPGDQLPVGVDRTSGLVRAVLQTADGTLWIGTGAMGLMRWRDGQLQSIGPEQGLPLRLVHALHADADGGVWAGSNLGMAHIAADGAVRYWAGDADMPARAAFDFLRDADGTLWVGTDRGLMRWRDGVFALIDQRHGLLQDRLFRLLDDGANLWLSSNRGVLLVPRAQLDSVLDGSTRALTVWTLDHTDGMPGQANGGSWPAGWRSAGGELLIPTGEGVAVIEPARLHTLRTHKVDVEVTAASIDGQAQDLWQTPVVVGAQARRLSMAWVGLDYQAPARVRYRYRLAGFEQAWVEAGSALEASYTNLPAGDYQFQVEAMQLPSGDWSERARIGSAVLAVQVQAPLWKHPLMLLLIGLGAAALVHALLWLRTRTLQRGQQRLKRIIDNATRELTRKNDELEYNARQRDELVRQLAHQASHDALTGLPNRRAAEHHLQALIARAQRNGSALTVALLDVDHFKAINDGYGHQTGDHVLRVLGQCLGDCTGLSIHGSRHGGEEFLLIIDGEQGQVAHARLDRLRRAIAALPVPLEGGATLHFSVSIGMASLGNGIDNLRQLLGTADRRLYQAKGQGRNRVVGG